MQSSINISISIPGTMAPRWRSGYAIACRAIPFRFESGPWLLLKNTIDHRFFCCEKGYLKEIMLADGGLCF